jgi:hypothetical protein
MERIGFFAQKAPPIDHLFKELLSPVPELYSRLIKRWRRGQGDRMLAEHNPAAMAFSQLEASAWFSAPREPPSSPTPVEFRVFSFQRAW